ncbi:MAG: NAD(P)-dependent oxidoreductase [Halobacteriales archaeon]|nr:NAD(P)-dependent oxidoreductase [Halobacteriales archaeon]
MKCFVTGATGFLGSHVAAALLDRGDTVTGLTSTRSNVDELQASGIDPVVGDIRNPEGWVDSAVEADVVVHTAQLPLPRRPTKRFVDRTIEAERAHLSGLLPRLGPETAFIYTSGIAIYGAGEHVNDERYPTDPFVRSRKDLVAERLILDAVVEDDVRATILRPAPIYGPGGLFHRFWGSKLSAGKRAAYAGSGDQIWSFVSIWDCVRAYLAAIDTPGEGEIFNVTDDEPVSMRVFLSALAEEMGAPEPFGIPRPIFRIVAGPIFSEPMFSGFPASSDKIRHRLGFEPEHPTYREGVTAVARAYVGNSPPVVSEEERSVRTSA